MLNTSLVSKGAAFRKSAPAILIAATALLMTGCAARTTTTGSIPDDYRTRHPITVSEQERAVDIPVATGDRQLTVSMREIIRGIAQDYKANSSGAVRIMSPMGSPNSAAASMLATEVRSVLAKEGVPDHRIIASPYQAAPEGDAAPIRVSFLAITAATGPCGNWPEDLVINTHENENWQNFGCSNQANLAAQIANPADLLAPRGMSPIDADRRSAAIEQYRSDGAEGPAGE